MLLALGDLLLDVIVRLDGPLRPGTDSRASTRVDSGGQAANVAAWTVALGGRARFAGTLGGDPAALLARAGVERRGVEVVGPAAEGEAGGVVVSLVAEDGGRTMISDRGVSPRLSPADVDEAWLDGCDGLHLSGYSLLRSPIDEAALALAGAARRRGVRVSVDLASTGAIADYGVDRFRARLHTLGPDVVFCNEDERDALGGSLEAPRAGAEARPGGLRRRVRRGAARAAGRAGGGGRHDRRRRRAGRGLPARRLAAGGRSARADGGRPLHRAAGGDAVKLVVTAREVSDALVDRRPVVALETTLVSHGFPEGEGAEVARASEQAVRDAGAVPATIGLVDGVLRVGLTDEELDRFARAGAEARKVGPRDVAACLAQKALGATTVGGTLAACRTAGIGFMATGGLGGVHRGFPEHNDVSADLGELLRAEVLVVCSGVKSLLDVPATAELLETLGIPVLGYRTDTLPLFYQASGGPPVSARVESAQEAARVAAVHWSLGQRSALLLARPPAESLDVEELIAETLEEAAREGVRGQAVTPFVLGRLHERSGGETLRVNRDLIVANAGLAGEVAVAFAAA